jgi:hypothetical protein
MLSIFFKGGEEKISNSAKPLARGVSKVRYVIKMASKL